MSFHIISPAGEMLLKKKRTVHLLEPDMTTAIRSQLLMCWKERPAGVAVAGCGEDSGSAIIKE